MYQPVAVKPAISIQQTRPAIAANIQTAPVPAVTVMSTDLPIPAVYRDGNSDRAGAIREIVLCRVSDLLRIRYTSEEWDRLTACINTVFRKQSGSKAKAKYPDIKIITALSYGMTWKAYAAKHPTLLVELEAYWEETPGVELSREAQRVIRFRNLMVRLAEKRCQRKSPKYRKLMKNA